VIDFSRAWLRFDGLIAGATFASGNTDHGTATPRPSPAGFGFSEFPRRAGAVRVTTSIKSRPPELSAGQAT
jgi:hypothetical protein